jgi:hypothetical protein
MFQRKVAKTQRGRAATKGILQKETKETKSEKKFAKNAQLSDIALQRCKELFAVLFRRIAHFWQNFPNRFSE